MDKESKTITVTYDRLHRQVKIIVYKGDPEATSTLMWKATMSLDAPHEESDEALIDRVIVFCERVN